MESNMKANDPRPKNERIEFILVKIWRVTTSIGLTPTNRTPSVKDSIGLENAEKPDRA